MVIKKIGSLDELDQLRDAAAGKQRQQAEQARARLVVGLGSCGIAAGAQEVWSTLESQVKLEHLSDVIVSKTGCMGLCSHEPTLEVALRNAPRVTYGHVTPELAKRILREHVLGGKIVEELVVDTTPFPTI